MGFFSDILTAALPWSESEAEAVKSEENESADDGAEAKDAESDDKDGNEGGDDEAEDKEDGGDDDEEEEEEEEELVDPKETYEEECRESKQCAPVKHHFDECIERVTGNSDKKAPHEDCVEEFFHLAHCANQCAAPKLWAALK